MRFAPWHKVMFAADGVSILPFVRAAATRAFTRAAPADQSPSTSAPLGALKRNSSEASAGLASSRVKRRKVT